MHRPDEQPSTSRLRDGLHRYRWLHIPSGKGGESTSSVPMARAQFLEELNRWNRQQFGTWLYVAEPRAD